MSEELIKTLANFKLFHGMTEHDLMIFQKVLTLETVEKDTLIIRENDTGSFIFLLLEGKVEITQALTLAIEKNSGDENAADTREKAFIRLDHTYYPFIGEMSLFEEGLKRSANVKALTRCSIAKLKNTDILSICDGYPNIGYHVMRNIAEKLSTDLRTANQNVLKLTTALNFVLE